MGKQKIIALVDCDSFFVSCEQKKNPELKNKPVCVLSNNDGCVISRSREAKKLGIRMGEPYFMAKKEHSKGIYVSADHSYYGEVSSQVMSVLKDFSPFVQIYSVDEAFVDFTGLAKYYKKNYYELARYLRQKILDEVDIPVSIGVSLTKTLSKLASDKAKNTNDGVFLIGNCKVEKVLKATNIDEIWGIGRRLTLSLKKSGILTAKELVDKSDIWLDKHIGIHGLEMKHELLGEIVSPVINETRKPKSIQNTRAFGIFTSDFSYIKNELNHHIHTSCRKLRLYDTKCLQVGVMLRTKDFKVYYAKQDLVVPTDFELEISKIAITLLSQIYQPDILYRATGVVLEKIGETGIEQLSLYSDQNIREKTEKLVQCFDSLEAKFGKNIIKTGFNEKKY
ncbi:Y-family DNA polymerase [bacterium]|nr:Y-family DNA polymerase [bacterium]